MLRSFLLSSLCLCVGVFGAITYTDEVRFLGADGNINYYDLNSWEHSITMTIDSSLVDADLTNFPMMVAINSSSGKTNTDLSGVFAEVGTNYLQIKIEDENGNQVFIESEKWDIANTQAWLWVRVPSVASNADTVLTLYYDKNEQNNTDFVGAVGTTQAGAVWSSDYAGVWHISEGGVGTRFDSTTNSNDGAPNNYDGDEPTSGRIDGADDLDGVNELINVPNAPEFNMQVHQTYSMWLNAGTIQDNDNVIWRFGGITYGFAAVGGSSGRLGFQVRTTEPLWRCADSFGPITNGLWYHAVGTYDGASVRLYINGEPEGIDAYVGGLISNATRNVWIGNNLDAGGRAFDGVVEEVRLSSQAKSGAEIKAWFNSDSDSLVTYTVIP